MTALRAGEGNNGEAITRFTGKYRWLSNFWPCSISLSDEEYQSVEHAYQASKTLSTLERANFRHPAVTAGQAKRMGKRVSLRKDWEQVKLSIMEDLLRKKFIALGGLPTPLGEMLLTTGSALLEENNDWGDYCWGVCRGRGQNHLGRLLMKIREELRSGHGQIR